MRPLLLLLLSVPALAQQYHLDPPQVAQGGTIHVYGPEAAQYARFQKHVAPLFAYRKEMFGLMPAGVVAEPGPYELEWLDAEGAVLHRTDVNVLDAHYATQNVVLSKAIAGLHSTPLERKTVDAFLKRQSAKRLWSEPLEAPLPGCITSPFGVTRLHNGKPTGEYHAGLDQRGAFGSPIHAVAGGTVKIVRRFKLRGGTVAIDHGQGLESIYLHMSRFHAQQGQRVKRGDVIGYVGSTGRSTGPHLHWTLYASGQPVDPSQWLAQKLTPCSGPPAQE